MRNKQKFKDWLEKMYHEKYLPAYSAFINCYPFQLENLEGEIWKDIAGYEGLYQISNFGRVKSFNGLWTKVKILKPSLRNNGYIFVTLFKNGKTKMFYIHQLVARAFIPNPENKPTVNHKFGNRLDNYCESLEWVTFAENQQHAFDTGIQKRGAESVFSKLTAEQVLYIRKNYKSYDINFSANALARKFGVSTATIYNIIHGKRYKNVE